MPLHCNRPTRFVYALRAEAFTMPHPTLFIHTSRAEAITMADMDFDIMNNGVLDDPLMATIPDGLDLVSSCRERGGRGGGRKGWRGEGSEGREVT